MDTSSFDSIINSLRGLEPTLRAQIELSLVPACISSGHLEQAEAFLLNAIATLGPASHPEAARNWLQLARAWARQDDAAEHVDAALQRAAALDPAVGRPALAQHLQRTRRTAEAAAEWAVVASANPQDASAALNLGRAYEQLDRADDATATYLRLVEAAPTARNYLTVAERLKSLPLPLEEALSRGEGGGSEIRIALLGNATLDQLASYVSVECRRAGFRPVVYQAPFDQYTQQMLDPTSGLYAFAPDVIILAVHASRLFPNIHHDPLALSDVDREAEIEAGLASMNRLLQACTQRTQALILVHNMVAPHHPAVGILDWRQQPGQAELFAEINRRLATLVRTTYRGVYVLDEDRIQSSVGKAHATDARQWLTARLPWTESVLLGLAREYMRFFKPYRARARKCVVLDLDNTLWGGVVGEDGIEGIQLGADAPGNAFVAFQRELERLWRRGILLAVCSKNNAEDALPVFDTHPAMLLRSSHFAAYRINWQPKPNNLRELAAELNIGLDSLVFIDDNPVERAAVRAELPEVLVPEWPGDPAQYRQALLELDVFESLALTDEDRNRGKLYAEQRTRREFEEASVGSSVEEYLADLQMVVEIAPASAATLPRIAQLTGKTNQFNVTTRRYTEGDLLAMQSRGYEVFGMRVTDRFGDNGLTGVAILGPVLDGAREIDTLLLSCRVMGRQVETALLDFLAERTRAEGGHVLRGDVVPTAKNEPARDCYARHDFTLLEEQANGTSVWQLDVAESAPRAPRWLTVRVPEVARP